MNHANHALPLGPCAGRHVAFRSEVERRRTGFDSPPMHEGSVFLSFLLRSFLFRVFFFTPVHFFLCLLLLFIFLVSPCLAAPRGHLWWAPTATLSRMCRHAVRSSRPIRPVGGLPPCLVSFLFLPLASSRCSSPGVLLCSPMLIGRSMASFFFFYPLVSFCLEYAYISS